MTTSGEVSWLRWVDPHPLILALCQGWQPVGILAADVTAFLFQHECQNTAHHCAAVALEATRIAALFGVDCRLAAQAGRLHDVSAVWPAGQRLAVAQALGLDILPEERQLPMILHQRLSAILAEQVFDVRDQAVLSAVGCHTTLKAGASRLDQVVFVADKLVWDQPGEGPFQPDLRTALGVSLQAACRVYLGYLWEQRSQLGVIHPWTAAAWAEYSISQG